MESVIDEVKNKIDIVELIGQYIPLKKAGRNYKANCPFHKENSPSFVISPDRQIWHCFGACGDGGDVIKFVMKWENITFYEALKELADKAGIQIKKLGFEDREWDKKEKIYKINNLAAEYYQYVLFNTKFGKPALDYLTQERRIPEAIAQKFQIGYSLNSWDSLLKFLQKKGFSVEDIVQSGVVVKNDKGRIYDRFRGRLMFPIKDVRGNTIGFSGRILGKSQKEAKYINSSETDVYHKRESLFGIHLAKEAIKAENNVLIVEGEFDMISPYQFSIENVVAIKGTALTKEQLTILKRLTSRLTFALDADAAGGEAMKRAIKEAEDLDFDLFVLDWEEAKDPDAMVHEHLQEFKQKLKSPISIYDFIIKLAQKKYPGKTAFDKKKIGEEVGPLLSSIKNPIIQSHYLKKIANILEVSDDSISSLLKQYQQKTAQQKVPFIQPKPTASLLSREETLEKYLLSYLFQCEKTYEIADVISPIILATDFTTLSYGKIYDMFLEFKQTHAETELKNFPNVLPAELQAVTNELYLYNIDELQELFPQSADEKVHIEKVALWIKKNSLKKRIQTLLGKSEDTQEQENDLVKMNISLKEVEKKMNSLYNY